MIDAAGNTVMPGIIESHIHLFPGGVELDSLMVTGIEGIDALTKVVRAYAKSRPDDAIIVANGANYTAIRPDSTITRQDLDQILPDRPFMMACFDHHTVWANTAALKVAGLLQGKSLPPGNEIVMAAGWARERRVEGDRRLRAALRDDADARPRGPRHGDRRGANSASDMPRSARPTRWR